VIHDAAVVLTFLIAGLGLWLMIEAGARIVERRRRARERDREIRDLIE
jgi:hypothetical protein